MGNHDVEWENRYSVGIESFDKQHRQLISMCNNLCLYCHTKDEISQDHFQQDMSGLVTFLRYHFLAEEHLLERINFPEYLSHKEEHGNIVGLLDQCLVYLGTDDEMRFKKAIPAIQDRILKHIIGPDRKYANYVRTMNRYIPWHVRTAAIRNLTTADAL
jgi:hemerythrin-like metal-binding protein